jgi:non-ribosomal peptide synthetase component F
MTILAIFKMLLAKYSSQNDITIGTSTAGRLQSSSENLIGFFINSLALRTQIKSNQSFKQLLTDVKQTVLEAMEHQDAPFEKIVEALAIKRDLSRSPIYQVLFVYQNVPSVSEIDLVGVQYQQRS